ncbi:hypothetical protein BJX65DRAFT_315216 [Aspergillus insuetus]
MGSDLTEDYDLYPDNYCSINNASSFYGGVDAPRKGWMTWGTDAAAQSTVQHFLDALTLWKKVNVLVESRTSPYFDTLLDLDAKLRRFYAHIPAELKSTDLFWSQNSDAVQRNGFCLESIYHCSLLRLYGSAIPALSGETKRGHLDVPLGISSYCTKVLLENLNAFGDLLKNYLCTCPDLSKIPSFLGYCAFTAGSTFSQLHAFGTGQRKSTSWAYGMLCLLFLDEIKGYYPVLNSKAQILRGQISQHDSVSLFLPSSALWELSLGLCMISPATQQPLGHPEDEFVEGAFISDVPFADAPFLDRGQHVNDREHATWNTASATSLGPNDDMGAMNVFLNTHTVATTAIPTLGQFNSEWNSVLAMSDLDDVETVSPTVALLHELNSTMDHVYQNTPLREGGRWEEDNLPDGN